MSESTSAASGGHVPTKHKHIKKVFKKHYGYYRDEDGEIAHQQSSGESTIRRAYSGRMVFELLQNAIDRAEEKVAVQFRETDTDAEAYQLIVANDGVPVRIHPNYPYDDPPDASDSNAERPDFNALCSLHTSNKSKDESIGTKGSGFRSVFSIETYVQVWSRFEERNDWWGLEMHAPIDKETWTSRQGHPAVQRGIEKYLSTTPLPPMSGDEERPSYHFPLPLSADSPLSMLTNGESFSTGVIVPIPAEAKPNIVSSFEQLKSHHLYFTGLADGNDGITVEFDILGESITKTTDPSNRTSPPEHTSEWSLLDWQTDDASSELTKQAKKADLDITYPGAAVVWPDRHPAHSANEEGEPTTKPAVYGYLPTVIDGPFGADFHGDFKLSIDRTNIRFEDAIIGDYNTRIAEIGAELHVLTAVQDVPALVEEIKWNDIDPDAVNQSTTATTLGREDFWRFLNPNNATSKAGKIVKKRVANILFDPDHGEKDSEKYCLWAKLASEFFAQREEWPIETYESFWETNLQWVDYFYGGTYRRQNWRKIAKQMCDALRTADAAVAPIVEGNDAEQAEAIPLPPSREPTAEGGSTKRKESALYIWDSDSDEFDLSKQFDLPEKLKNDDRVVTTYAFDDDLYKHSPNPLGATEFTRWQVLDELRQLPNSLTRLAAFESPGAKTDDRGGKVEQQYELIRFAAQLYQLDTGGTQAIPAESDQYDVGWRMRDDLSDPRQRAGRSLATLFLPISGDTEESDPLWAPARQLTQDQVAVDRIRPLPEEVDVVGFLAFLGVAPAPPADGVTLTLVEGGADGRVPPRETPPGLDAAERGPPDATLAELRPENHPVSDPAGWRRSLRAAYNDWLEPLIKLEQEATAAEQTDADDSEAVHCWTNLVETLGEWPWYPVSDSSEDDGATPPAVGYDERTAVCPTQITVHSSRQTQFPKLVYGVEDTVESAQLLVALGAIDGLDPDYLRENDAERAYRLLDFLADIPPVEIETPGLQQILVDLYTRLLDSIVRGDEHARNRTDLPLLVYESGETGMALSERTLTWTPSAADAWITKDRPDQRTIHQYFPTIPLVAAPVAPTHFDAADPLADRTITLTDAVLMEPTTGTSDEVTNALFNQLVGLAPRLLALAEATSNATIDRSTLTDNWGPDRIRRAETVWQELTVEYNDTSRTKPNLKDSQGTVLVTPEDPQRIVFDSPTDAERPPLSAFGEALAELLIDQNASDLFARALRMAEDGSDHLDAFVEDRGAKSLVPTYQNVFDPLTAEEHDILVEEMTNALNKHEISLKTTAASELRILRPEDIQVPENALKTDEALTEADINTTLAEIDLPESRDWSGYRPRFRCTESHYTEWQTWFDARETYLIGYLREFLEERGITEYSDDSLTDALDTYARDTVCPRIRFQPRQVVGDWLAKQDLEDVPETEELLRRAEQYKSSFDPVVKVKEMGDEGIEPGEIDELTIGPEEGGGTLSAAEVTRTKRAQMAYGENAEQAALDKIVGMTKAALDKVRGDDDVTTVFGTAVTDIPDAVDILCWPFYDGGVTETHIREHMDEYASDGDTAALRTALHISTVWDGAGFDIIGLEHTDGQVYPVRYEIKSLSNPNSSTIAHLSQKQYAVYKEIRNGEATDPSQAGDWRLYGVTEDGVAVNITDWLDTLPDEALASLRAQGIEPDGLILSTGHESDTEPE